MSNGGQRTKQGDATRAKILEAITMFYETHSYSPTIREIREMTGIKSTSTVHRQLKVIKEDENLPLEATIQRSKDGDASRMRILNAINTYQEKNGFSPTVRELSDMTGLKSTSTVHQHLIVLKEQGKISWNPTMPRTIKVL